MVTENTMESNSKGSDISRRGLLKSFIASGACTASAIHLTTDEVDAAASDETEIVVGYSSDDPDNPHETFSPVTDYVPTDWYEELLRAREVNEKLKSKYIGREGIVSQSVLAGVLGGETASIEFGIAPDAAGEPASVLPEMVNGIPIKTTERSRPTPDSCSTCYNSGDYYSTIPGGVRGVGTRSSGECGTLASRVYDSSGNYKFATAHHLYSGTDVSGEDLYHPSTSDPRIGYVDNSLCGDDTVIVEPDNHTPERRVDGGLNEDITGQYTMDGIDQLKSNNIAVHKVGCTSGYTSGAIHSSNTTYTYGYGCIPRYGQVTWGTSSDSQGGDSGALVAAVGDDSNVSDWAVSMDQWSNDSHVGGVGAYRLLNKHGYHF